MFVSDIWRVPYSCCNLHVAKFAHS